MDCIFCKIVRGEIPPGKGKVWEDENFIAFLDIQPLIEGHTLVIPKKHFQTLLDVPNSLAGEYLDAIKKTCFELTKKFDAEGFNLINNINSVAGQIVPHVHVHLIPRKKNDGKFLDLIDKK